jgi:hypothetical protein
VEFFYQSVAGSGSRVSRTPFKKGGSMGRKRHNCGIDVAAFHNGVKIGMNDEIFRNLQTMGLRAAVLAGAAVAGSLILIFLWEKFAWKSQASEEADA